jgi:hypothetical protein
MTNRILTAAFAARTAALAADSGEPRTSTRRVYMENFDAAQDALEVAKSDLRAALGLNAARQIIRAAKVAASNAN